jgi:methylated-DNA-[protein]-cysteine S-methyltransferase
MLRAEDTASAVIVTPIGPLTVTTSDHGVVRIDFGALPAIGAVARDPAPSAKAHLDLALTQLGDYFAGERRTFTVPLDRAGRTGFRGEVLEALEAVEFGGTVSYGELAALAGRPRAARAVGTAMSTNPIPILVPCHRVLRAGGDIGEYGGGIEAKVWLLAMEKAAGRSAVGAGR